ncbi:MAG: hypothetical protein JWM58_2512 [Rhizobium sp.]|nr:hypothetical protein [Rhizobium sp.]
MSETRTIEGDAPKRVSDLHDLIDESIRLTIAKANAGGWTNEEILLAIEDVMKKRWLDRLGAQENLQPQFAANFVSDGNEG